ncbi:MAG TPA: pyruvate kinase [Mycobacterium sp.]|nr:pyruvate kinase [Mycobacterium sp.]
MSEAAEKLDRLQRELDVLLGSLRDSELRWVDLVAEVAPEHRQSAVNLVHYWALRQTDLRDLQWRLSEFGLSSIGHSEAHVQATLQLVYAAVTAMLGPSWDPHTYHPAVGLGEGAELLERNATQLFGLAAQDRAARIMVTLPTEAAWDTALVTGLLASGMRIARINCAHDDARTWKAMAANVRAAATTTGRPCLIAMDLAGPKLRTGPIEPGPQVVRIRPNRNALGQVQTAGKAWLTSDRRPAPPPEPDMVSIPVDKNWLRRRCEGDHLNVKDARGARRVLRITAAGRGGFVVTTEKSVYLSTGAKLKVAGVKDATTVGALPHHDDAIRLTAGDILRVTRDCSPVRIDDESCAQIGCTLPEIFDVTEIGQRILFDDGRLGGQVIARTPEHLDLRIDHPSRGSVNLRGGKGINLPNVDLPIPALTEQDRKDLKAVAEIADIVNLSFVREPADVIALFDELDRLCAPNIGVVLKIETPKAFEQLPQLLLSAMRRPRVGVMIARGDLAVESGYERMAELQDETLRICAAAHLPVVWATQVLEQLAKSGRPSRAEITDAAMSERAECVMLNKGPFILDAVIALDHILGRMAGRDYKGTSLLNGLKSWQRLWAESPSTPGDLVGSGGTDIQR